MLYNFRNQLLLQRSKSKECSHPCVSKVDAVMYNFLAFQMKRRHGDSITAIKNIVVFKCQLSDQSGLYRGFQKLKV